jgi:hypothetical protein
MEVKSLRTEFGALGNWKMKRVIFSHARSSLKH